MFDFIADNSDQILLSSWQHFGLVVRCVVPAAVIAVVLAALVHRSPSLASPANGVSAVGLRDVNPALVEAAHGIGMRRMRTPLRIELPLARPVSASRHRGKCSTSSWTDFSAMPSTREPTASRSPRTAGPLHR